MVCDRFVDSTRAYQGMELGTAKIDALYAQIAGDFRPDLTLLLDVPVATGMARVAARRGPDDRYQQRPQAFHEKLRAAYLDLAAKEPNRFRVIEAGGDQDAVSGAVHVVLAARFAWPI